MNKKNNNKLILVLIFLSVVGFSYVWQTHIRKRPATCSLCSLAKYCENCTDGLCDCYLECNGKTNDFPTKCKAEYNK